MTTQNAVLGVFGTDLLQALARRIDIEVPVQADVGGRRVRAFLQAGVRQRVEHHMIVGPHQTLDDAVPGSPAGRVEHGMIEVEEFADGAFELQRIFGVTGKRRGASAVHAILVDHRLGDLLDLRIGGEAEIVLRREVEPGESEAAVVARRANSERRALCRFRIRPQAALPSQILPLVEAADASDQVLAAQLAKVAHAPGKGLNRIEPAMLGHDAAP